ncbi:MAG: tRNA uridine(34) 5-carboxymethylaminomethyl modification radical SAM/GNAT enzyme Elp3 [Candidatus Thermoplasmatota archaeon]|nr:tRNA uridine(34) 5-carboxymethylaminomethyl modification radical SAM/GNAT enzyme Elp3 [Candidatus Thermoplasmatota archaeon]
MSPRRPPSTPHPDPLASLADRLFSAAEQGAVASKQEIEDYKKEFCRRHSLQRVPTNAQILARLSPRQRDLLRPLLQKKPVRTLSGVAVVAVMTSPHPCPHGRCLPCPGGPPDSAQSYTGREPAALRAIAHGYDPHSQVQSRLEQLAAVGHPTDKVELIIMGGTFTARHLAYQDWFVRRCYDALNETAAPASTLLQAQESNQRARHRCVGLTVETRPDWCRLQQVDTMLGEGVTRVELGAQILDDAVLYTMRRGHTVVDIRRATRLAKDAGLKVCYHLMPGLPGSNPDVDLDSFRRMVEEPDYRPDLLKIYPTLVVAPSLLYEQWRQGRYRPLDTEEAARLIADMKALVPPWMRIQRVERDIPAPLISAGVTRSNLRQLVHEVMEGQGRRCRCIRCREAGHRAYKEGVEPSEVSLYQERYPASGGEEVFISALDAARDVLVGYCRLRFPATPHRPEVTPDDALLRELRVTGPLVPLGKPGEEEWQHRGYGRRLLHRAEEVAAEAGKRKMAVLSGVGVRPYYRRLGYVDDGVYVSKCLL